MDNLIFLQNSENCDFAKLYKKEERIYVIVFNYNMEESGFEDVKEAEKFIKSTKGIYRICMIIMLTIKNLKKEEIIK